MVISGQSLQDFSDAIGSNEALGNEENCSLSDDTMVQGKVEDPEPR